MERGTNFTSKPVLKSSRPESGLSEAECKRWEAYLMNAYYVHDSHEMRRLIRLWMQRVREQVEKAKEQSDAGTARRTT